MTKVVAGVASAALVVGAFVAPSPASASASQGYIGGASTITDDWGDEGTLSRTSYANSSATGLWQRVLVADGLLTLQQVDCEFGPTTEAATKTWQSRNGLTADGKVGPATFGKADSRLTQSGSYIYYNGSNSRLALKRIDGRYQILFYNGNDIWSVAYYGSKSQYC